MQNDVLTSSQASRHEETGKCCRLCQAPLTKTFVDLGMSPLCESFLAAHEIDRMEPYFPLHVLVCDKCFLVQLQEYVNPENIFSEYAYFSSYSTSWVEHAKKYCHMITDRLCLGATSQVYEIASNDGYLLQHFLPFGVPITGIEPAANVAEVARAKGVPTLVEFFGIDLARRLADEGRQADLIVGNNVLAQVPDLNGFTAGMAHLLKPEGVITLEVPHLTRLMDENQFDTIYHEHFSYFSLTTLAHLASRHGLRVFDIEELPTHGGSIRVYMCREQASYASTSSVAKLRAEEKALGFDYIDFYLKFAPKVHATKRKLLSFLIDCKERGRRICGYGAPGKGNTLLNYCGIGVDFLDFTVDRNPYKHGRFTPGMHIPILPISAIEDARPDYVLILPWNLRDEIAAQLHYTAKWGCKLIVPIPEVHVIEPGEAQE
jgi:SAM-dependent methyltransferase